MTDFAHVLPGSRLGGQLFQPRSPVLRERYPEGVYVDLRGVPDWLPYCRTVVEIAEPPPGLAVDEVRVTDVLIANETVAGRRSDPLWTIGEDEPGPAATPAGWVWAHLPFSRRLGLVPAELHGAFRHAGGMTTLEVPRGRRGLDLYPDERIGRVPFDVDGSVEEAALVALEELLERPLPPVYRDFLARTNGARPVTPGLDDRFGFVVDQPLFGVGRPDRQQDVGYANLWFGDRLTSDFIAIGYLQGGLLVLRTTGDDADSIWYLDDDDHRDDDGYRPDVICRDLLWRAGDTLERFWTGLIDVPDQYIEIVVSALQRGYTHVIHPPGTGTALPASHRAP